MMINFVDDVQGVPVTLAPRIGVVDTGHQHRVNDLRVIVAFGLSAPEAHHHIRLRRCLLVLGFIVAFPDRHILGVDLDLPLDAQGTFQPLMGEKLL